ncbi:hypothetical protein KC320_g151 [Hortaea werneckii]|nr:hypothetical protein KC320_g151 [Hortaea werneckii]
MPLHTPALVWRDARGTSSVVPGSRDLPCFITWARLSYCLKKDVVTRRLHDNIDFVSTPSNQHQPIPKPPNAKSFLGAWPSEHTSPEPIVTVRICPRSWWCQYVRAPGVKQTLLAMQSSARSANKLDPYGPFPRRSPSAAWKPLSGVLEQVLLPLLEPRSLHDVPAETGSLRFAELLRSARKQSGKCRTRRFRGRSLKDTKKFQGHLIIASVQSLERVSFIGGARRVTRGGHIKR